MNIESCKQIINELIKSTKEAGIYEKMFIGFGTLLGAVRERSIIKHDTDMDICFLPLTKEEKENYFQVCKKYGLFNGWPHKVIEESDRVSKNDAGEIVWFSTKLGSNETKCCNWFFIEHKNFLFHTKANYWMKKNFPYMKGIPKDFIDPLVEITYLDTKVMAPKNTGSCLDFWYPNWLQPRYEGESCHDIICSVPNFKEESTWKLI